jgi:hypothetical protein
MVGASIHGFVCVPAVPATVGAYLASMATSHAPTVGTTEMQWFND